MADPVMQKIKKPNKRRNYKVTDYKPNYPPTHQGGPKLQLTAYEIAIIGGGFTVVGTLTGVLVSYWLSLRLSAINAKRDATQRFISTFHRELSGLYPYPIKWPENIAVFLDSKFTVLNAAVGEFRHYLPPAEWDGFDKVWFCFYGHTGREIDIKSCQCYHNYIEFGSNPNFKENFKHDVDNLLRFAKLT